jgi:ADP-ribosylglycohydrolase
MGELTRFPDPDRILGCLLGGAIGDALGAPIEGTSLAGIRTEYGEDGLKEYSGTRVREGAITDQTQLTLFTAEALVQASIRARSKGIGGAVLGILQWSYLRWLQSQDETIPDQLRVDDDWLSTRPEMRARRGAGRTCLSALRKAAERGKPGHPLGTVETPINDSKGCGGMTRTAPIGLGFSPFVPAGIPECRKGVFELGCSAAALTHGHPSGYLPAGVLAATVWGLLRGADLPGALEAARAELETQRGHDETSRALDAATALAATGPPTPEQLETLGGGWVGEEALAIGVCAALTGTGPTAVPTALRLAVNHSGDSDSTGSICGNLLGARFGSAGLPGHWQSGVETRRIIIQIAADTALEFGPNPPTEPHWDDVPKSWFSRHLQA